MFNSVKKISLILTAISVITFVCMPLMAKDGPVAGKIDSINKKTKEIVINTESGKTLKMGDKIYVRIDGQPVILEVTFPMMTTSKCKPEKKNEKKFSSITKGLTVYRYEKGIEEVETEAVDESLYAGNPLVGTWDYTANIHETRDYNNGKLTFRANGTYLRTMNKSDKDSGKFRFDIEKGVLEFVDKKGTSMFYAGPLKLLSKEDNSLTFIFRHQEGYLIEFKITHNNTAPFKIAKESE